MTAKPAVARMSTQTYRLWRFVHRSVEISRAARITSPPMVGVPALLRCRSGVSSRMVSPPRWSARSRPISQGPRTNEITIAVTVAMAVRKVM